MDVKKAKLRITMPDGSRWDVPVSIIANHRANYYKDEFGGNLDRSLEEDTWPVFEDEFEIEDWAASNMNWEDVKAWATKVDEEIEVDYQEGWLNGEKEVVSD